MKKAQSQSDNLSSSGFIWAFVLTLFFYSAFRQYVLLGFIGKKAVEFIVRYVVVLITSYL